MINDKANDVIEEFIFEISFLIINFSLSNLKNAFVTSSCKVMLFKTVGKKTRFIETRTRGVGTDDQ